jgi:predicted DsbA family dithiol-disulfide isomerase
VEVAMPSELTVAVYFDLICPWCLIGKRNLEAAIALLGESDPTLSVKVDWRSAQLLPRLPDDGVDFTVFYEGRLGGAAAVRLRQAQVQAAASAAGCAIVFERIRRMPNTARAHRLLHFARRNGAQDRFERLLDRLFRAYFVDGLDIGDPQILADLAEACGYVADAAKPVVDDTSLDHEWRQQAPGVPFYVFEGGASISGAHPPQTLHQQLRRSAGREVALLRHADSSRDR